MRTILRRFGYILALLSLAVLLTLIQYLTGLGDAGIIMDSTGIQGTCARLWDKLSPYGRGLFRGAELAKQNDALRAQNEMLLAERERLAALGVENERLQSLLQLRQEKFRRGVVARVCGRDPNLWYKQMVIDRGSSDGVFTDGVVVAPGGLVGRISGVDASSARVMLLQDANMAVPVMLASSGALGILYGDESISCTMKFISHDVEIADGEVVLTSGFGDVYPKGIVVGRVARQFGRSEALFQTVQVSPSVDTGSLQEVLVIDRLRKAPKGSAYKLDKVLVYPKVKQAEGQRRANKVAAPSPAVKASPTKVGGAKGAGKVPRSKAAKTGAARSTSPSASASSSALVAPSGLASPRASVAPRALAGASASVAPIALAGASALVAPIALEGASASVAPSALAGASAFASPSASVAPRALAGASALARGDMLPNTSTRGGERGV